MNPINCIKDAVKSRTTERRFEQKNDRGIRKLQWMQQGERGLSSVMWTPSLILSNRSVLSNKFIISSLHNSREQELLGTMCHKAICDCLLNMWLARKSKKN